MRACVIAALTAWLVTPTVFATSRQPSCVASPIENRLPAIVGPMSGASPVWFVDGGDQWKDARYPVKTLWILRATSEPVRISGRQLDGPGAITLRRGDAAPEDALLVANAIAESVVPGGAPPDVMREYTFLPSHVLYPSRGCWQFTVEVGRETFHLVRDLR